MLCCIQLVINTFLQTRTFGAVGIRLLYHITRCQWFSILTERFTICTLYTVGCNGILHLTFCSHFPSNSYFPRR